MELQLHIPEIKVLEDRVESLEMRLTHIVALLIAQDRRGRYTIEEAMNMLLASEGQR
tara:strand:- start:696 stop:866 length:171 start_codon:yes stop_codon:yes gene_type:complete